ncbi:MAG: nucleotidyltransferase family protein [Chloroflexota bacterium]|nr:nucleotidyltransferase family protein [Chloroflexota bacterium]
MEDDVAADVIRRLRSIGAKYYITGSEALARYGEPRQTADIDIVLDMDPVDFHRVERAFRSDYVVNEPVGSGDRKIGSVVALTGLGKADLILGRRDAWARRAMARREAWDHPHLGDVWVLSLEDLILAKLEWSEGVSELQLRDCANLIRTNAATVDWTYLERNARVLGVERLLDRLRPATA